jgi:hypothetical protein
LVEVTEDYQYEGEFLKIFSRKTRSRSPDKFEEENFTIFAQPREHI